MVGLTNRSKDSRRRQRGAIVNIASLASQIAIPNSAAYIAAKHAVCGLTKSATFEYAVKGVRCNAVAPGWIHTPLTHQSADADRLFAWATQPDRTPLSRGGHPEEIAEVIAFLCSEEASFVAGAVWNIDGGYACI